VVAGDLKVAGPNSIPRWKLLSFCFQHGGVSLRNLLLSVVFHPHRNSEQTESGPAVCGFSISLQWCLVEQWTSPGNILAATKSFSNSFGSPIN
jgi:hypothetical protein